MNIVSAALGDAMVVPAVFPMAGMVYRGRSGHGRLWLSVPRVKRRQLLECNLWQAIELPTPEDGRASTIVLGTVTGIHIADEVIVDGKIDVTIYKPLARLGYLDYAQITTLFEIKRPGI